MMLVDVGCISHDVGWSWLMLFDWRDYAYYDRDYLLSYGNTYEAANIAVTRTLAMEMQRTTGRFSSLQALITRR